VRAKWKRGRPRAGKTYKKGMPVRGHVYKVDNRLQIEVTPKGVAMWIDKRVILDASMFKLDGTVSISTEAMTQIQSAEGYYVDGKHVHYKFKGWDDADNNT
jgi:hypothetical protein